MNNNRRINQENIIRSIESRPLVLEEFDDKLWAVAVERVTVMLEGRLMFSFKDSTEVDG